MILALLAALWLLSSTVLGFLVGGVIRLADRYAAPCEDAPDTEAAAS